jgi:co-chaperonin GroES (HSP10)
MAVVVMKSEVNPRDELINKIGDTSGIELFNTQVLVAKFVRPQKTRGGILLTDNTRKEDIYQGKIGLVVAMGHSAFKEDDGKWFNYADIGLHTWVMYRTSDGLDMLVNDVDCKVLKDQAILGRVRDPLSIW